MKSENHIKISFLGDISLNDNYIQYYKEGINPFVNIKPVLGASNYVIGNLECMAKGEKGENEFKKPRLTTTTETLNYLNNINLSIACLAQNHIYDHLEDGFLKTTEFLKKNNIQQLGAGFTHDEAIKPIILEHENIKIALLNYITEDTNPNLPKNAGIKLNMFEIEKCKQDIFKLKANVNHVVLSLHWGGRVEGGLFPDWDQPKIARQLIDAGADLIIGHHSHTIQPFEIYKEKYIFYSLGNFCFSDYWTEGKLVPMPKRRMISTIIKATFNEYDYKIQTDYFLNKKETFCKLKNYNKRIKIRNLIFRLFLRNKPGWKVYYFHKQLVLPIILFFGRKDISLKTKIFRFIKYIRKKI